jgi:hypothetical protein
MMCVYTNFYLENSSAYQDIDKLYTRSEDGDENVTDKFVGGDNFVTQRIAYPEFYTTSGHPLKEDVEAYPK